jgi:hypothetical protein
VFLVPQDEADSTERAHFVVRFAATDSTQVIETYAINYYGNLFGVQAQDAAPQAPAH